MNYKEYFQINQWILVGSGIECSNIIAPNVIRTQLWSSHQSSASRTLRKRTFERDGSDRSGSTNPKNRPTRTGTPAGH